MGTYWRDKVKLLDGGLFSEHRAFETLIMGSGLTGMLTAYMFEKGNRYKERDEVRICDNGKIAGGHTESSMGILSCLPGMTCCELVDLLGKRKTKKYLGYCRRAIDDYERFIRKKKIKCDFERLPLYLYSMDKNNNLDREAELAGILKLRAEKVTDTGLPFEVENAVRYDNQAQMNILEFLNGIINKLTIREDIDITFKVMRVIEAFFSGEESCRFVRETIFTTNCIPDRFKDTKYDILEETRSAIMVISGCKPLNAIYHCVDEGGITMRSDDENILLQIDVDASDEDGEKAHELLRAFCREHFPEGKETHFWVAVGHTTPTGIPFVEYSKCATAYVAFGTSKGGPVVSMVAAKILFKIVRGKYCPAKRLFEPYEIHR